MASNYFGEVFRFTTFGESHGPAIGCVVDGVPAGIDFDESLIQSDLDKRKPGQSKFTTQRQEGDKVEILSGIFEGKTLGSPICAIIRNTDQRSHDYGEIKNSFRPNHADYTYDKKYGIRDYRGGGRSSARETASRVIAGSIAKMMIKKIHGTTLDIRASVVQIGEKSVDKSRIDFDYVYKNPLYIGDESSLDEMSSYLDSVRKSGNSVGAMIEINVSGMPVGLGEPIYHKLDSEIAKGMMSINAVKAVEIGSGFDLASKLGSEAVDSMRKKDDKVAFEANNSGGVLGGISSGQDLVCRIAVKPTSSILIPSNTIDKNGNNTSISTKGRHDPCVGLRAVPVAEAMMACIIADLSLRNKLSQL